jgi:hypothetical protein
LIETTGVHFLLKRWNGFYAWILTGFSIYTCMQLSAHIRAIRLRPIRVSEHRINMHMGLAADAIVQLTNIESIELTKKNFEEKGMIKIALIKGLENHNMMIRLKEPVEVIKLFGIKKRASAILFYTDELEKLLASINEYRSLLNP